jgi:DNA-binding transcriptional regulator/RsmH inhibitor MraZ
MTAIDGKGRVAIPAAMRAVIEKNVERLGGEQRTVIIGLHPKDPCLIGYDPAWLKLAHARIERAADEAGDEIDFNLARRRLGLTESAGFDASGRFILPDFYAMKGRLLPGTDAVFQGAGNFFEIWNPDVLLATPGIDETVKELVAFTRAKRGAK